MSTQNIEILLSIPQELSEYKNELQSFISDIINTSSKEIEASFTNTLSRKTQIVIPLIYTKLLSDDKSYYKKYQDREFRFLFYYFQDVEIDLDDFDDEIFDRVEFKDEIKDIIKVCNNFTKIDDLKQKLEIQLKESIQDLINRTNHSKINSKVLNRSKREKYYDSNNNLRKVDNFLRRENRVSLINGLGGVGKTTLAIEYATDALENTIYDYAIWLDVENGIYNEIQKFAITYLVSDVDDGKQGEEYYLKKFTTFITDNPNSLVILDNYENRPEELDKYLKEFDRVDTIITSRQTIKNQKVSPIELDVFQDKNDALEMFLLNSTRKYCLEEKLVLQEIVQGLGNLPLALEITAKFLDDSSLEVEVYLEELKKEGLKLFDKLEDYTHDYHLKNLKATLKINSKVVKNQNSMKLLKCFSLLSPEPIKKEIIEEYLCKELQISDFDKTLSLKELEKFSYIKKTEESYSMHRLLQEAIVLEYFKEEKKEQEELITKISLGIFHWFEDEFYNKKYGSYFESTKEHLDYLLEKWQILDIDEARIYIYTCISAYLENISSQSLECLEYSKKAISLLENSSNNITIKDKDKLSILFTYITGLRRNNNFDEAGYYLSLADELNISEESKSNLYHFKGQVYYEKKEYIKAKEFYEKSLEIKVKNNDNNLTVTYNDLALTYMGLKDFIKAEEYYKKSLDLKVKNLGENHFFTAIPYSNLGVLYKNQKKYLQSFKNYYLALKICLNIELFPKNLDSIEKYFYSLSRLKESMKKIPKEQKAPINKKIDELNKLFESKKLKYKIRKLK